MAFCSFSKNAAMYDATPIENIFLLEYLPSAPDEFLRVYLYARMLCLHPELGGDLADVAKALRMEEDAVFNAFAYWEQQGLVERLTDRPPSYAILPVKYDTVCRLNEMDRDYYEYRDFNSELQNLFGSQHLLHPRQYKAANDWLNVLGFTREAAVKMLEYEIKCPGAKDPAAVFKRADKRAIEWADRGIRTAEDVERAIAYDSRVYGLADRVMKQFSIRRKPTMNELDCVRRWIDEWKLSDEEIIAACSQTTASRSPSIAYLDAILKAKQERGEEYFEEARAVLREMGAYDTRPTADDRRIYENLRKAGFDTETIMLAAARCRRKHKHDFAELEWMLGEWGKDNVFTAGQAMRYLADMDALTAELRRVMGKAGLTRYPNKDDKDRYTAWKKRFSSELIDCAAEFSSGTAMPMRYMDKLLSEWEKAGISTPEQARAKRGKKTEAAAKTDYQQHDYSGDDYKDFFNDPLKDFAEGSDDK